MKEIIPRRKAKDLTERFTSLQQAMSDLLSEFSHGTDWSPEWSAFGGDFVPSVDVSEKGNTMRVSLEVPGIDAKDIDISLNGDQLTIKGKKEFQKEEKEENRYRSERRYGSFQRSVHLPAEPDPEKVTAELKKGVLTLSIEKTEAAKTKSRQVKVKEA